jgi:hypothetical protein
MTQGDGARPIEVEIIYREGVRVWVSEKLAQDLVDDGKAKLTGRTRPSPDNKMIVPDYSRHDGRTR